MVRPEKKLTLRESFLDLCFGDVLDALLLDYCAGLTHREVVVDQWVQDNAKAEGMEIREGDGWWAKSVADIATDSMLGLGRATVHRRLNKLVDEGLLETRKGKHSQEYRVTSSVLELLGWVNKMERVVSPARHAVSPERHDVSVVGQGVSPAPPLYPPS